jgi:serine/threonine protein kinase/Tol biopolymer transport system component
MIFSLSNCVSQWIARAVDTQGTLPMIGKTLGHYRVGEQLGRGGMGEVYVADDLNLNRKVALKFLPDAFTGDPERMARFEREARLLASLNHPNIAAIHGLEEAEEKRFLVLEFVEGETLAQRLIKGPLPVEEALAVCRQIAEALEAAHEKGVIHRDLKPANVMITEGDKVKILDFGLAKALSEETQSIDSSQSPTLTEAMTRPGIILGTAAYMSPEQAKGKTVDKRADIWAFGCILYECLTGKIAFEGETVSETLAAILKGEPDWQALPATAPPSIRFVLRRCLEKELRRRFHDAADVRIEIEEVRDIGKPTVPAKRSWPWLAWTGTVVAIAVALAAVLVPRMTSKPSAPALARFAVTAPPGMTVVTDGASMAVSPDGRRLAFIAADSTGMAQLCIRNLDSLSARQISGTWGAILPFWSSDSRFIAFFAEGKLKKVPADGGLPEVICDAPSGRGGSWSKNGVIIFAPQAMGPLLKISADGGDVVEINKPDSSRHETGFRFPCFLPDGRHYLFVSLPRKREGFDIYLSELDSKQSTRIMAAGGAPVPAVTGCLLFVRGNRIAAQEFDRHKLRPTGQIIPLGDAPPASSFEGAPLLSASENGVLIHAATNLPNTQLVWLDRMGRAVGTVALPPASYGNPSLSVDSRWATVSIANSPTSYDLWLVDLQRAVTTRLTFDGLLAAGGGTGSAAVWAPDGSRVAYMCNQSGLYDIYQVLTNGTGKPEPLVQSDVVFKAPVTWSPDGKYLVFSQNVEKTQWDLWLLPMQGDRKPVPYLRTPYDENTAALSPDGRWMAYSSNETGRAEIYVRSFPEPREKHRISVSGGTAAQWSQDGRELLFLSSDQMAYTVGSIFTVDVQTSPSFKAGAPRLLFTPRQDLMGIAATADLKRFLAAVPVEGSASPSITVMLNWQTVLKK